MVKRCRIVFVYIYIKNLVDSIEGGLIISKWCVSVRALKIVNAIFFYSILANCNFLAKDQGFVVLSFQLKRFCVRQRSRGSLYFCRFLSNNGLKKVRIGFRISFRERFIPFKEQRIKLNDLYDFFPLLLCTHILIFKFFLRFYNL